MNLYSMKKLPSWGVILEHLNLLNTLHQFCKYARVKELNQRLKYSIFKGFLTEVDLCIYHLPGQ